MSEITIREATESDAETIKAMVHREHLNPLSLKWQNFLIAEVDDAIAGIGQIKPYGDCEELASIITNPDYRGQGVARRLIAQLEDSAGRPLYLKCAAPMESYYKQFGYETITWREAPLSFKGFGLLMQILSLVGIQGRIMRKDT